MIVAVATPTAALADPFVQEKGTGRIITNAFITKSSRAFNDAGAVEDINDYDQDQFFLNAQYGVTDDLTVILAPSIRTVRVQNAPGTSGLGYSELGLRYRLAKGSNWMVSTQGLVRIPGKKRADRLAQVGSTSTDFDLRLGGALTGATTFVSAEAGYRLRSGLASDEIHADATIGWHPTKPLLLLATSQNTFSTGVDRTLLNRRYKYGDLHVSAVYDVTPKVAVQAGYTATIYGRNALRQRGFFAGLWLKF